MDERSSVTRRQLNPFAFPAETDQRFVLFATAALAWAANWGALVGVMIEDLGVTPGQEPAATSTSSSFVLWAVILPAAVLIAGLVLYLLHPSSIVRRQRLRALGPEQDGTLALEVQRLAALAGLSVPPRIYIRAGNQTDAQAFGRAAPYAIGLDEGLRLLLRKSPAAFRAIVLHELAHIANRDIRRHYLAQGLWTATLWLTILPFIVFLLIYAATSPKFGLLLAGDGSQVQFFLTRTAPTFLLLIVQLAAGLLMAAAIRGSLLRVRETYADWRATLWGAGSELKMLLGRHASAPETSRASLQQRIERLVRMHPTPAERLAALAAPERLFRVTPELGLFVGWLTSTVLFGVATPYLVGLVTAFSGLSGINANDVATGNVVASLFGFAAAFLLLIALLFLPFFVLAFAVMRSLGLQVAREAVGRAYAGDPGRGLYARLWREALRLALGMHLGFMTSYPGAIVFWDIISFAASLLLQFPILVVVLWASLAAQAYFSRRLLAVRTGPNPPVADLRLLSIAFGLLLGVPLMLFVVAIFGALFRSGRIAGWSATALKVPGDQVMLLVAGVELGLFVVLYTGLFVAGWLMTVWRRRSQLRRCPSCGTPMADGTIGQPCRQCGGELAAWLTVQRAEQR